MVTRQALIMRRFLHQVIQGLPATDGAGVELVRMIGQPALSMLDPFLLLDAFRSDNPDDYIAGFPPHPHRGFETVTYLLNGKMRHQDSAGHEGVIEPGGVQWMTAGKGIIHSEMPEQKDGLLEGFQLWINLPAYHKMDEPVYQEFSAEKIPVEYRQGCETRVITGKTSHGTTGPVVQPLTQPLYLDVSLVPDQQWKETLPLMHNAFIYGIQGETLVNDIHDKPQNILKDQLAILTQGHEVTLTAGSSGSRFLFVSGKPLNEPVARGGPFVMNFENEVHQAMSDYRSGKF